VAIFGADTPRQRAQKVPVVHRAVGKEGERQVRAYVVDALELLAKLLFQRRLLMLEHPRVTNRREPLAVGVEE